jgi:hypothetical protein
MLIIFFKSGAAIRHGGACSCSKPQAEARAFQVWGQPGLHNVALSQKTNSNNKSESTYFLKVFHQTQSARQKPPHGCPATSLSLSLTLLPHWLWSRNPGLVVFPPMWQAMTTSGYLYMLFHWPTCRLPFLSWIIFLVRPSSATLLKVTRGWRHGCNGRCLPSKGEALSSNPRTAKKKKPETECHKSYTS